jgi:hypothetical protein
VVLFRAHSTAGVLLGFVILWFILERTAAELGNLRGEAGIFVCAAWMVVSAVSP